MPTRVRAVARLDEPYWLWPPYKDLGADHFSRHDRNKNRGTTFGRLNDLGCNVSTAGFHRNQGSITGPDVGSDLTVRRISSGRP